MKNSSMGNPKAIHCFILIFSGLRSVFRHERKRGVFQHCFILIFSGLRSVSGTSGKGVCLALFYFNFSWTPKCFHARAEKGRVSALFYFNFPWTPKARADKIKMSYHNYTLYILVLISGIVWLFPCNPCYFNKKTLTEKYFGCDPKL